MTGDPIDTKRQQLDEADDAIAAAITELEDRLRKFRLGVGIDIDPRRGLCYDKHEGKWGLWAWDDNSQEVKRLRDFRRDDRAQLFEFILENIRPMIEKAIDDRLSKRQQIAAKARRTLGELAALGKEQK